MNTACHACGRAGEEICIATFYCRRCSKDREVCTHLPGGLEAFTGVVVMGGAECVICQEKRTMSEEWIDEFHKKKPAEPPASNN